MNERLKIDWELGIIANSLDYSRSKFDQGRPDKPVIGKHFWQHSYPHFALTDPCTLAVCQRLLADTVHSVGRVQA